MRHEDRILEKLDKIDDRLNTVDVTLAKQHEQLAHHIHRTNLLEEVVEKLRADVKPVQAHVQRIDGGLKLVGFVAVLLGILASVLKVVEFFAN